ncbi:tRNA uridine-5-carboxymethylaminomethyl(34) synthesis GTPase MnmE [Emticicia agri]|uniref:tRNA modification GTPase MnmE n=1 Tax=Emticicia agri TaxID=2492393 RepID=A0A4Q5LVZ5_9BACT|nr:tRNA uridine-5-carboxymethylaminomethyl(34) synthesis GTPase MnmE [Emticicia agri]RYU93926.1 tRNA uridine-5-carboxymethylaminomethyl(34) synthesis GTPase MnmE [Emticicia agri]
MVQLDTICALATPQGVGAIGVIRVSGEQTLAIVNKIFKGKDLTKVESHTIHFGTIRDYTDNTKGKIIDEVLLSVFKTPRSFTKEDVIEISCHGSDYIIRYILKLLIQNGCHMAKPGEFTQRAFLNGQFDLVQAEAVADLIAADSEAAHKTALNQMRGGFSTQLKILREELVHFASLVELELDFGEEDVEFAGREDLRQLILKIQNFLKKLIDSFDAGNVIKEGIPVAIIGPPNAGKSTLLNILLNEEKAIVTEIAGTTRDVIEDILFIGGMKFRIIDTAGIRETKDVVETIGIERSKQAMEKAEIVILLFENEIDQLFLANTFADIVKDKEVIWVRNKIDLYSTAAAASPNPLLEGEGLKKLPSPSGRGVGGEEGVTSEKVKSAFNIVSTNLLKKARELRRNSTETEKILWELLRDRLLGGKKFRRQHPLEENYILDFYCDECKLGIEIDGVHHGNETQKKYDKARTTDIEFIYGIKILRFTNEEVLRNIEKVLETITESFSAAAASSPPTPLLEGGEGSESVVEAVKPSPSRRGLGEVYSTIHISAKNNIGIEDLKNTILAKSKLKKQSDTMLTNLRHYEHLIKAHDALSEVLNGLSSGITGDFLAQDIRLSLYHLGEITGQITTDDLLANIFSKFCIGK